MAFWLFKTEPNEYSIDNLAQEKRGYGVWDGIRNYQARNFLRDDVAKGDLVFIYHSACKPTAIVGIAKVVRAAYADPVQFQADSHYFDPKSTEQNPRWFCVDVAYQSRFSSPVTLSEIKREPILESMALLKQARLSVSPVTEQEWEAILRLSVQQNG
ncbi:EVE domain-containing protein [Marinibactrum halimedae]|uniref:Ubiquinol-cytochrome c reductase n=1 Tax=Marinibactrum halimedae TaxID=1444977 RepID=A0AA37T1T6_9GAMM|nr:EVE domain-containing protein [Marinibactrum halimedae]MCD9459916.1 EVE domain-containing protein [Marinibactrum halimedae]GLS25229.1 ubiquinol-cytochrome c reductase [Marinibactrum halimedae]